MTIEDAQREVRTVFLGGFPGQLVSSALWLVSAALGTWVSPKSGMLSLVVGGMFLFPVAQLLLRSMGRRASLSRENHMTQLAQQVAFTIPLGLPLAGAAALHRIDWFFPACALIVGAHYLPFIFLYGMRMFGALAALLIGGALLIALYGPRVFSLAGWYTALVLLVFAFVGLALARKEEALAGAV